MLPATDGARESRLTAPFAANDTQCIACRLRGWFWRCAALHHGEATTLSSCCHCRCQASQMCRRNVVSHMQENLIFWLTHTDINNTPECYSLQWRLPQKGRKSVSRVIPVTTSMKGKCKLTHTSNVLPLVVRFFVPLHCAPLFVRIHHNRSILSISSNFIFM